MKGTVTYQKAGVDIGKADRLLNGLRGLMRSTHGPEVLPDRGQFAGLVALPARRFREPVLVASTDGVGTKLKLAQRASRHEGIGVDVVAMNVNDVLVYGARPLLFLDYIAIGTLTPAILTPLIRGVAKGCRMSGCALVGGETAEMPGVYQPKDYDIAGFCVGVVERGRLLDGSRIRVGDAVVGLASSGVHANGFSLVRKAVRPAALTRLTAALLVPTRIYVQPVLDALERFTIGAIAHVTGGGLTRRLPGLASAQPGLSVCWEPGRWQVPAIFRAIQAAGRLDSTEMYATFNMGIGMALACRSRQARQLIQFFARRGIPAWTIGTIERK